MRRAHKKQGKRHDNLLAKIAALTETDLDAVREAATPELYAVEDKAYVKQAAINFFYTRVKPEIPQQKPGESKPKYAARCAEYERAFNEWRFRECKGCKETFAYAYHYEGVLHCSLECLDAELRKIGVAVTPGKDPAIRWGNQHPAIVNSETLRSFEDAYSPDVSLAETTLQKPHRFQDDLDRNSDTQTEQDN